MKYLLRNTFIYAFALYVLPNLLSGLRVQGGLLTYVYGGMILTLMMILLKPVLNLISIPMNIVTLGLFSVVTNAIILYILTVFVTDITIQSFSIPQLSYAGFTIPELSFSPVFAYIAVAFFLFLFTGALRWAFE